MRTEEGATKLVIRTLSRAACWLAVATFLLLFASPSSPQSGTIDGTVVDHADGALPGVVVTVMSSEARQQGVTDAVGWFSFTGLPAGDYVVTAALPGCVTRVSVQTGTTATVNLALSPNFPPDLAPQLVSSHYRSWGAVVFGWPFIGVAVVLFGVGLLRRHSSFVLLGSFFAAPSCLYLTGTPRFWYIGLSVWLSKITAAWALARGWTTTAALLVIPFVGLASFLAWLVMTQPEPW